MRSFWFGMTGFIVMYIFVVVFKLKNIYLDWTSIDHAFYIYDSYALDQIRPLDNFFLYLTFARVRNLSALTSPHVVFLQLTFNCWLLNFFNVCFQSY